MRILVAYATKEGSTAGIAETIGDELTKRGLQAEVREVRQVRNVTPYDAVVLGSALYIFRWRREALRFGKRHARELRARPVWLFGSGPLDRSAEEKEIPPVKGAAKLMALLGARGHATFGGKLVPTSPGFVARKMIESGNTGDFRNFDQIRGWARGIAEELRGPAVVEAA